MYYNYTAKDLPAKKDSYVNYVNSLRAHFTIRVEVKREINQSVSTLKAEHTAIRNELKAFLSEILNIENYHIQEDSGYHGWFYTWFMDKEDALAFALKFGGKVV